jgi:hypothetical protein
MSESKPHLFISHATWQTNNNQRTIEIRQQLFQLLSKDWDVFVDKERLNPGAKWRPIILDRLSKAQAGIILFDKTAVEKSHWVKAEALIMCFRWSIDPDFQLIPVFLDDLKPEDEGFKAYQPFQLKEVVFQFDDCHKTTAEISQKIVDNLHVDKAETAQTFYGWMSAFENLLNTAEQNALLKAWGSLIDEKDEAISFDNENELRRAIVQLIHQSKPLETLPAIKELRTAFLNEQLEKIGKLIKAKWVENESVEVVFRSTRSPREKVTLIYFVPDMIDNSLDLIDCLFDRLKSECPSNYAIDKISVDTAAGDGDEAILAHIENTIIKNLGSRIYPPQSEKNKQRILEKLSKRERSTICYIPRAFAKSEILSELHQRYSELVFLVEVDSEEIKNQFNAPGVKDLTPLLDEEKLDELDELLDEWRVISQ